MPRSLYGDVIPFDLLVQGFDIYPEKPGGLHLLATRLLEDARQVKPLHFRQGAGAARGSAPRSDVGREVLRADDFSWGEDQQAFDRVRKLPNVARP